jgi:hypothetical protein
MANLQTISALEDTTVATFWRVLKPWTWIGAALIVVVVMVWLIPEDIP